MKYRRPAKDVEAFFVKGSESRPACVLIESQDGTQQELTPEEFQSEGYAKIERDRKRPSRAKVAAPAPDHELEPERTGPGRPRRVSAAA